jgi:hypothetical protein
VSHGGGLSRLSLQVDSRGECGDCWTRAAASIQVVAIRDGASGGSVIDPKVVETLPVALGELQPEDKTRAVLGTWNRSWVARWSVRNLLRTSVCLTRPATRSATKALRVRIARARPQQTAAEDRRAA